MFIQPPPSLSNVSRMNRQVILNLLAKSGALRLARRYWGSNCLTVLAYHRVTTLKPNFDTFVPNISATPEDFAQQMAFVKRWFNVVSMEEVANWLQTEDALPPYPALITFDDGYRDNYTNAFPILKRLGLPATIFLATQHIGAKRPFFWDLVAYCFHHTQQTQANLPHLGLRVWRTVAERDETMLAWLDQLKQLRDGGKWTAVNQLPDLLAVTVPSNAFENLYLNWDEVREMQQMQIHMGAHTHTHPILTRLEPAQAEREIQRSKEEIETKTERRVLGFAYPNGQPTDYAPVHSEHLERAHIPLAFTLEPAPARLAEAQQAPHFIRRILIDRHDTFPRFMAKTTGLTRLAGFPQ